MRSVIVKSKALKSLLLIPALSLAVACAKDLPTEQVAQVDAQGVEVLGGTRNLNLSFEVDGAVLDSLTDQDGLRALPLLVGDKGKPTVKITSGTTTTGHIYILRRAKGSTSDADANYLTVLSNQTFELSTQTGTNKIQMSLNLSNASIKGYVNDADALKYDWYMSVMLGGTVSDNNLVYNPITEANLMVSSHTANSVVDVPYGFGWTKFSFSDLQALGTNKVKPLGYFVRFNILNALENNTGREYLNLYRIYGLYVKSADLFTNAKFVPSLKASNIASGLVTWENNAVKADSTVWSTLKKVPLLTVDKTTASQQQYFWLWFASDKPTEASEMTVRIQGEGPEIRAAKNYNFSMTLVPMTGYQEGSTALRTLKIVSKDLGTSYDVHPMFWPSSYGDVASLGSPSTEMGTEQRSGVDGLKPARLSYTSNNTAFYGGMNDTNKSVRPNANRFLPTMMDWATIFPFSFRQETLWNGSEYDFKWFKQGYNHQSALRQAIRRRSDPNYRYSASDIYQYKEDFVTDLRAQKIYAIRFQDATQGIGNKFRSAWRYHYDANSKWIRVDIMQFGNQDLDYQTGMPPNAVLIANDSWWATAIRDKRVLTHYFPFGGAKNFTGSAFYITATTDGNTPIYFAMDQNGFASYKEGRNLIGVKDRNSYGAYKDAKARYFMINPELK